MRYFWSLTLSVLIIFSVFNSACIYSSAQAEELSDGIVGSSITMAENIQLAVQIRITNSNAKFVEVVAPGCESAVYSIEDLPHNANIYLLCTDIAVKNANDDIIYRILDNNYEVLLIQSTSVLNYCQNYKSSYPDGIYSKLVDALVAYANASEKYFDRSESDEAVVADFSSIPDAVFSGTLPTGLIHRSATLIIESETTLRHYFVLNDGMDISSYTFFLDINLDGECTDAFGEQLVPKKAEHLYYVEIDGISPNSLSQMPRLGVSDGTSVYTCTYGPLNYTKNVYTNPVSTNTTKSLAAAILEYSRQADKFMGEEIPLYTAESENYIDTVSFSDKTFVDKIRSTPDAERILTIRLDFTYAFFDGYLQLMLDGNKYYRLIQFSSEGSYTARVSTNIIASSASPKFVSGGMKKADIPHRLEIVLDYTLGKIRCYMDGCKVLDEEPITPLPAWDSIGTSSGVFMKLTSSSTQLFSKGVYIYIGNSGK